LQTGRSMTYKVRARPDMNVRSILEQHMGDHNLHFEI